MDENLLNRVDLSLDELERAILSKCGDPSAKLVGLEQSEMPNMGTGFLSSILPVELSWSGEGTDALPKSVIVKAPTPAKMEAGGEGYSVQMADFVTVGHAAECRALQRLADVDGLPVPKVYYTRQFTKEKNGLIIMEDLRHAVHFPIGKGGTDAQLLALLDCYAALHAHTYNMAGDGWQEGFLFGKELYEKPLQAVPRDFLPLLEKVGGDRMKAALARVPADSVVRSASALAELYADGCAARHVGLPPVLVHCDTWTCNMLWLPDVGGGAGDRLAALIDWQVTRVGAPTEDIANTLAMSAPGGGYRQRNLDRLLRHYYDRLCARVRPAPFTYDQLRAAYDRTLAFTATFVIFRAALFIGSGMVTEQEDVRFLLEAVYEALDAMLAV